MALVWQNWHFGSCAQLFKKEKVDRYMSNNFNSSNAVVCSHLILAYTVRLAIINAVELERNGWFFLPLLRNVVL